MDSKKFVVLVGDFNVILMVCDVYKFECWIEDVLFCEEMWVVFD